MNVTIPRMTEWVKPAVSGEVEIKYRVVSEAESRMENLRHAMHGNGICMVEPGKYVVLYINSVLMMSDTQMERRTNWEVLRKANGDVLIGGLGIGMLVKPISEKDEVRSVTVLEKSSDLIRAMKQQRLFKNGAVKAKVSLVEADVFTWNPDKKYDTIYFDIWPNLSTDNLPQIAKLHQRYKGTLNRKNPSAWMGSWIQDYLRSLKRSDRLW